MDKGVLAQNLSVLIYKVGVTALSSVMCITACGEGSFSPTSGVH